MAISHVARIGALGLTLLLALALALPAVAAFNATLAPHGQRCYSNRGTCMFKSTCQQKRQLLPGHCEGTSYCCLDLPNSPEFPLGPEGLCGEYARSKIGHKENNAKDLVPVVAVLKPHLTDPAMFGKNDTQADNLLLAPAACVYDILRQEAARAGHDLTINSAFRSYARQEYFWECYQCRVRQGGDPTGCCNDGNVAAKPGTSNHGTGIALDVQQTTGAYNWMRLNAEGLGWVRTVPSERWHWEYRPGTKQTDFFPLDPEVAVE